MGKAWETPKGTPMVWAKLAFLLVLEAGDRNTIKNAEMNIKYPT